MKLANLTIALLIVSIGALLSGCASTGNRAPQWKGYKSMLTQCPAREFIGESV